MKIAVTGATGNMGRAVMEELVKLDDVNGIRVLSRSEKRVKKLLKVFGKKTEAVIGSIADEAACAKLIDGCEYVVNLGGVIPPLADKYPRSAVEANEAGTKALVAAIERVKENQPKLIHISTMAVYGDRNYLHPWGRVGDPLIPGPFELYAATKMRGEFAVLESDIQNRVVLRQTAMLHDNILMGNLSDGLMFHTCFNAPIEWVTARDSGVLIANIIKKDRAGETDGFWNKCYNVGGGDKNRITGYDSLSNGFTLIGGTVKDYFLPYYNAARNFHGMWFTDGDELNAMFGYISESCDEFWARLSKKHPCYKLAKLLPKKLIRAVAIKRLFKNYNSPAYWAKHGDDERLTAYFGGRNAYDSIPKKWADYGLLREGTVNGVKVDYAALKADKNTKLDYGFDFDKPDGEIDIADLRSVAEAHGGKLISSDFTTGDMYRKLDWETQDGERFSATAYTVLRAGHWYNPLYREFVWDFDRLAKRDRIYAQLWYDAHDKDENKRYAFDGDFKPIKNS